MAVLVILDAGLEDALNRLTGYTSFNVFKTCNIGLYTNNQNPVQSDTLGSFTEAAWAGYARQAVANFGAATLSGGTWSALGDPVLIPNTSGINQSAYGLLVFDSFTGTLIAASLFDLAPVTVSTIGIIVQITVQDTD